MKTKLKKIKNSNGSFHHYGHNKTFDWHGMSLERYSLKKGYYTVDLTLWKNDAPHGISVEIEKEIL